MRKRDALKKKYYKTRSASDWENYRAIRNKVVKMRRSATQAHFTHLCKERHGDQKKFWRTIKPYVNSRKNVDIGQTIVLKDN